MTGLYSMLLEYTKLMVQAPNESSKVIKNEIQLVLRNSGAPTEQIREGKLFRDLAKDDGTNNELNHILNKIRRAPYIIVPEVTQQEEPQPPAENFEDNIFNASEVVSEEVIQKFPDIDPKVLESLIPQGINSGIKEAVIRRVIPIASITTRSLVMKDFALETDPRKMKEASEYTAKSLAGMLALVT